MSNQYIAFVGEYKDLIPKYGFRFQKMFAGNYRSYWKNMSGEYGPYVIVWQKGAELDICDWHHLSAPILKYLLNGTYHKNLPWQHVQSKLFPYSQPYLNICAYRDTSEVREFDYLKDEPTIWHATFKDIKGRKPTKEELDKWMKDTNYESKRNIIIHKDFYDFLMDLLKSGMFELRDIENASCAEA